MRRIVAAWVVLVTLLVTFAPSRAHAFCGFYVSGADQKLFNNATQVVLMREGLRTVLSMENNYQGPPQAFAMVVPVPIVLQKENVKTLTHDVFDRVDKLAAPRLVEYWEQDPCAPPKPPPMAPMAAGPGMLLRAASGGGGGDLGVKIEAQFTVGEYEILILSASDSMGLETWLHREKYNIPQGAEPILRPYVQSGMKFFVAKVDSTKVTFANGMATLSPLRFHYDSDKFTLPIRLGLVNSPGTQDLIVHILARGQRYEVANYPNVTVPTNFDVDEKARDQFPTFYASLFDRTVEKTPKAVVTEYAWDASSCDPCPIPALSMQDLTTLGADVLPVAGATPPPSPATRTAGSPSAAMPRPPPRRFFGGGFVLTRLHARYGKETLGDDLVFKEAAPIVGGREFMTDGTLEHGAQPAGYNNFQGRYAIRHPWAGPIACEKPTRGRWGGPPGAAYDGNKPKVATNTAFAPRGSVQLTSFVKSDVPELGLTGGGAAGAPPTNSPVAAPAPVPAPAPAAAPSGAAAPSVTPPAAKGCAGCSTPGARASDGAIFAAIGALAFVLRRRKR